MTGVYQESTSSGSYKLPITQDLMNKPPHVRTCKIITDYKIHTASQIIIIKCPIDVISDSRSMRH